MVCPLFTLFLEEMSKFLMLINQCSEKRVATDGRYIILSVSLLTAAASPTLTKTEYQVITCLLKTMK